MSVRVMNQVWLHCHARAPAKFVCLCLADFAHDDGSGAYPSLTTIEKRTGLSRRVIPKLIHELEAGGYVTAHRSPGRATQYVVHPTRERRALAALGNEATEVGNAMPPTREPDVATREPRSPEPPEPPREPSQPQVVAVHEELYGRRPSHGKERWLASMEARFGPDRTELALRSEHRHDPDPKTICGRMERGLKAGNNLQQLGGAA